MHFCFLCCFILMCEELHWDDSNRELFAEQRAPYKLYTIAVQSKQKCNILIASVCNMMPYLQSMASALALIFPALLCFN